MPIGPLALLVLLVFSACESREPPEAGKPEAEAQTSPPPLVVSLGPASVEIIPAGTVIPVKLETPLSSKENRRGDSFIVTTMEPLRLGSRDILPSGARITGLVEAVNRTKRFSQKGSITIGFDGVEVAPDLTVPLVATIVADDSGPAFTAPYRLEKDIAIAAGAAALGALLAGGSGDDEQTWTGLLAGAAVGAGVLLLSEGPEIELPVGLQFRIRLEEEVFLPRLEEVGE